MLHWIHEIEIGRYFRGRLDGRATDRVLGRLGRCPGCRAHYQRHLRIERVLPDGEARRDDRLWGAIMQSAGLAPPPEGPRRRWMPLAMATATAAAAAVVVVLAPRLHTPLHPIAEPVARGRQAETAPVPAPALFIYRSGGPGRSERVAGTVHAGDGLLLAYSNPTADLRYLMIFAVDGAGSIYWYHPAFERPGQNPAAVPIRTQAFGVELGDEVHQPLLPGRLTVFALFLPQPRSVLEVEAIVQRDRGRVELPGARVVAVPLQVTP